MAVAIVNSYTCTLTSHLAIPKLEPIVNSFEEWAASPNRKITVDASSVLTDLILVTLMKISSGSQLMILAYADLNLRDFVFFLLI